MAQFGRALRSGRRGRKFESCHADFRTLKQVLFLFNRKYLVTLTCKSPSLLNKKDAPQDAQRAERYLIATQYRSHAEIAQTRNLFIFTH